MALRSLGSSLVAKSTPGSATRDLLEKQISKPAIPGKGEIGTTSRDLVSEPQVVAAAPGSEKIVAAGPGVEGSQVISPTDVAPTQTMQPLLAGGMGLPQGPGQAGSNNMAMMDGSASRVAASAPTAGRSATARSGGPVAGSSIAGGNISVPGASTSVTAPRSQSMYEMAPSTGTTWGSKVIAAPENAPTAPIKVSSQPSAAQEFFGGVGKALTSVGSSLGLGQLVPGGLGAKLQTYGGQPTRVQTGSSGSIAQDFSNVARPLTLRSMVDVAKQAASQGYSKLRSLFKR